MKQDTVTISMDAGYVATASSRHVTWQADLEEEKGGTDSAPTPEEMLLGALGACMAQTGKLYAERKGWQIDSIEIKLSFERFRGEDYAAYEGDANFVHEITESVTINGDLDDAQRERVLEIMGKCPVRRLIANPVFFVDQNEKVAE